eukprot:12900167-Prorocentrum_lima.AAC.1
MRLLTGAAAKLRLSEVQRQGATQSKYRWQTGSKPRLVSTDRTSPDEALEVWLTRHGDKVQPDTRELLTGAVNQIRTLLDR